MKMNGFGKRFLSLLLAMVALVGLLSVGAMAGDDDSGDDTATIQAPTVTLKVGTLTQNTKDPTKYSAQITYETNCYEYDADIQAGWSMNGVTTIALTLDISDGLEYVGLSAGTAGMVVADSTAKAVTAVIAANAYDDSSILLGGISGLLGTVVVKVKDGAYGDQTIGFSTESKLLVTYSEQPLPAENLTLVPATLSLPKVTLTLDYSGHGGTNTTIDMAKGTVPTKPANPTEPGYTFGGWLDSDGGEFDFTKSLNEDATAYAKWTPNQTTVTFDVNGGNALAEGEGTKTVTYGQTYGNLPTPTYTGMVFRGWFTAKEGGEQVTADTNVPATLAATQTLYAHWGDKTELVFDETPQKVTYNGNAQQFELKSNTTYSPAPSVTVQYSETGKNNFSTTSPVVSGTYDVKLTAEEDDTYKALEKTITGGLVIEKISVTKPTKIEQTYEYTGNTITYQYYAPQQSIDPKDPYRVSESASQLTGTNAGTELKVVYELEDTSNYKWAGETDPEKESAPLTYSAMIQPKKIDKPAQDTSTFTYNETEHTYTVEESDWYTVAGNQKTDAGTHTVTVALKDKTNTTWADSTTADLEYSFVIHKAALPVPTTTSTTLVYNGKEQQFVATFDPAVPTKINVTGNKATTVGSYTAKYNITDDYKDNYYWQGQSESETEYTIAFSITPMLVTPPTAMSKTYTYTGSSQTFEFTTWESSLYEVLSNTNERKEAGTQQVKVQLKDKENTVWKDTETTADKEFTFEIAKADRTAPENVSAVDESVYKLADGQLKGLDRALMEYKLKDSANDYVQPAKENLTGLAAGTYLVRYAADPNHNASPDTEVTIAAGKKLKASFDANGGSDVTAQGELGYGDPVTKPETTRTGCALVGWYTEDTLKNEWDFATDRMGKEDITLYAKWTLSIGIEGDAKFTEGKAPAEGVKVIVGKGIELTAETAALKNVTVDGKKLDEDNYTIAYGTDGLTITLKQDYLNTLGDDVYKIGVVVDSTDFDKCDLAVKLTVEPEPTAAAGSDKSTKGSKAVKTGDSSDLLLWSVVSLGAGAGLVCVGKKRREN